MLSMARATVRHGQRNTGLARFYSTNKVSPGAFQDTRRRLLTLERGCWAVCIRLAASDSHYSTSLVDIVQTTWGRDMSARCLWVESGKRKVHLGFDVWNLRLMSCSWQRGKQISRRLRELFVRNIAVIHARRWDVW